MRLGFAMQVEMVHFHALEAYLDLPPIEGRHIVCIYPEA
jgi:hypothetical protein